MVPKAFKEVKQQVDIVGKGRGDHGDSSWKGFAVFSRRTCHYRLCQVIYAHPSCKLHSAIALIGTVRWHCPVTCKARSMPSSQRRSGSLPHDRCFTNAMKSGSVAYKPVIIGSGSSR